ncbi:MAG: bifunctional diaminohydroxyphosphoribosylaminopyrimidine deaminase/5-amino-6-(5-phosphoribosylamino)uracil reductase RibD [Burkholderiaceae bacterium]|jgi:diaminohydroxyphosphoribosylaminopyrimidine deaminase/5-amino-6-(5-phosphoribosylamino)uracil reductase
MFTSEDHRWMLRAIELAARGMDTTTPNPRVGCVVVRDGEMVGEGWHVRAGEPHAEVIALAHAGARARGATVYLTLEPCSHHGRTPPCTDALIEAKVARVIAAMEDPNPLVNGEGLTRLRAAGIDVRCGLLGAQAADLNPGFVSRMTRGLPWVRMKVAASLDGFTALPDGRSQWITGEAAREDGHRWRARACAILTGIGTVREDNPQLTARLEGVRRQPIKVLVDSRLEVDLQARMLKGGDVLVVCSQERSDKAAELRDRGCEVLALPNPSGKVDLPALMRTLAGRGINEVHVEAGHKLNASLLRERCVDELLAYLSASLLGGGRPMFELEAVASLDERIALDLQSVERLGNDVRLLARVARAG